MDGWCCELKHLSVLYMSISGSTKQTKLTCTVQRKCSFTLSHFTLEVLNKYYSKPLSQLRSGITSTHLFNILHTHVHPLTQTATQSLRNNSHIAAILCFFFCLFAYYAALSHLLTLLVCAHVSHIRHQISDRASCSINLTSSSTDFLILSSDSHILNSSQTHCNVARRGRFPCKAAQLLVLWGILFVAWCMGPLVQEGLRGWG